MLTRRTALIRKLPYYIVSIFEASQICLFASQTKMTTVTDDTHLQVWVRLCTQRCERENPNDDTLFKKQGYVSGIFRLTEKAASKNLPRLDKLMNSAGGVVQFG